MKLRIYKILLLCFFLPRLALADNISFSGSAPAEVLAGQQFRLVYTVNAEAENFTAPEIKGFAILAGPTQSSSSSIQIINNQVSRSFSYTFTYTLVAQQEGTFTIPPARLSAGGKQYSSNAVTIKVRPATSPPPGTTAPKDQQAPGTISSKDVFLRATVDKTNPYQGEQIIVTYRLYTRIPVSNYHIEQAPSTTGFWSEELSRDRTRLLQYTDVVDGQQYTVAELRKVALFPQRSGTLRIEPLEVEIVARVQQQQQRRRTGDPFFDNFFDDPFFGRRTQNVQHTLRSNALNINVKPLPVQNRPAQFSGAVGDFKISATVDKTEPAANDPINLKVVISGKGNIRLIDKLNFQFPPSFEVYDPKISTDVQVTPTGVSGTRTLEYLIIPRSAGNFSIKPAAFSYFHPIREQYITMNTPEFNFSIVRGEGMDMATGIAAGDQQAIQYIASDIRFIRQGPFRLQTIGSYFFGSVKFYALYLSPLVFFGLFVALLQNHIKNNTDIARVKIRRATRIARKRLKQADEFLKLRMDEKFFNELSQALWGYLSDKFNLPLAELSLETVRSRLENRSVNTEIINDFIGVLEQCEFARFAPGEKSQTMDELYQRALALITRIEKELK
ncbi:MAG TPA: protein BatD [Bacteroidales bacterium]|nr:protein BatD [Bacteroidales bacterium]